MAALEAPAPDDQRVHLVRTSEDVNAEAIETEQAEIDDDALHVTFGGERFKCKTARHPGAFAVMCARVKANGDLATQLAAPIKLLLTWIEPTEHDRLLDQLSDIPDIEAWMGGEFKTAMEAMVTRPSQAP